MKIMRNKTNELKKAVMKRAWAIARETAKNEKCTVKECFAWSLSKAWVEAKMLFAGASFVPETAVLSEIAKYWYGVSYKSWAIIDTDDDTVLVIHSSLSTLKGMQESNSFSWLFEGKRHLAYVSGYDLPLLLY